MTIWLLASGINGVLRWLAAIFSAVIHYDLTENLIVAVSISLSSLAPGFFVFWFVLMVKTSSNTKERALFRCALRVGCILAIITALLARALLAGSFGKFSFEVASSIAIATITSIMLHYHCFKKIK